jgi:gluconolactonase
MRRHMLGSDGKTLGIGEIFATSTAGYFDGFRIDTGNRIWTSAMDGVHCYDSAGCLIGKILIPEIVSNVCFGGLKRNRLFITATSSVYAVYLNVNGCRLQ